MRPTLSELTEAFTLRPTQVAALAETIRHPAQPVDLRDYFAAQALVGMLASGTYDYKHPEECYEIADRLLAAREGK